MVLEGSKVAEEARNTVTCPECMGFGGFIFSPEEEGEVEVEIPCPHCRGRGKVNAKWAIQFYKDLAESWGGRVEEKGKNLVAFQNINGGVEEHYFYDERSKVWSYHRGYYFCYLSMLENLGYENLATKVTCGKHSLDKHGLK